MKFHVVGIMIIVSSFMILPMDDNQNNGRILVRSESTDLEEKLDINSLFAIDEEQLHAEEKLKKRWGLTRSGSRNLKLKNVILDEVATNLMLEEMATNAIGRRLSLQYGGVSFCDLTFNLDDQDEDYSDDLYVLGCNTLSMRFKKAPYHEIYNIGSDTDAPRRWTLIALEMIKQHKSQEVMKPCQIGEIIEQHHNNTWVEWFACRNVSNISNVYHMRNVQKFNHSLKARRLLAALSDNDMFLAPEIMIDLVSIAQEPKK